MMEQEYEGRKNDSMKAETQSNAITCMTKTFPMKTVENAAHGRYPFTLVNYSYDEYLLG